MDEDKKLTETLEQYQELAKKDKNLDVAALMLSALQKSEENRVSSKTRKWLYILSLGFPPIGVIFALKYYFFDDHDDARHVANMCLILTALVIILTLIFFKSLFSAAGVTPSQVEQIKPSDIYQLTQ